MQQRRLWRDLADLLKGVDAALGTVLEPVGTVGLLLDLGVLGLDEREPEFLIQLRSELRQISIKIAINQRVRTSLVIAGIDLSAAATEFRRTQRDDAR